VENLINKYGFNTLALHAGQTPDPSTLALGVPVHRTSSFVFRDSEHAANLFGLKELGNKSTVTNWLLPEIFMAARSPFFMTFCPSSVSLLNLPTAQIQALFRERSTQKLVPYSWNPLVTRNFVCQISLKLEKWL